MIIRKAERADYGINSPKLDYIFDFKANFAAFILYLFEEFPGCTEDALERIKRPDLRSKIDKIKSKETLEDDEEFVKRLQKSPSTLKSKIPVALFDQIYLEYKRYYNKNKIKFEDRTRAIKKNLNKKQINEILIKIKEKTNISFKIKNINIWLVDIYYIKSKREIEGTTTPRGIYIGLPERPLKIFYGILIHELVHYNLKGRYSEDIEEVIAQIAGLEISKEVLGKVPEQLWNTAKKRVPRLTKMKFEEVIDLWNRSKFISSFVKSIR